MSFPAFAQNRANVSVDLGRAVNVLTDTSLGVPALTFDGNSFNKAGAPYLRAAGITAGKQLRQLRANGRDAGPSGDRCQLWG